MALGLDSGGLGSRRSRDMRTLSEINVTPFVDVLLVLLVIFMLTANVMEFGIEIEVPKVRLQRESAKELPVIEITKNSDLFLNGKPVNINDLAGAVQKRFGKNQSVYLRADKQTKYDVIAQVLSEMGDAKIGVNMVTKTDDARSR